jgi:glycosyltransferase involved in cell wall biosynthesis
MKVLNLTEGTVVLGDITTPVAYSRNREPIEIPDDLARSSKDLRYALGARMLLDVTKGIPDELPKPISFDTKKSILTTMDKPFKADPRCTAVPMRLDGTGSAFTQYKQDRKMSVVWTGPAADAGGYARMNRKFMFGLDRAGVKVNYEVLPSMGDMDPNTVRELSRLSSVNVPKDAPKIYGMTSPLIYDWSRYKMLFTMMETRRLHPEYANRCNCADEIVVPSRWCKDVFIESGVKKPIAVVPLGVDTSIYRRDVEPLSFGGKLKEYVFLSVFGWSLRKGYDVLLKAYLEEFTSDDPVTLLISSRYFGSTDECKKKVIRDDIAKISSMVQNPKKPQIVLFGDVLSDTLMPRLYASADCYVLPSRGEGFGLPYLEAGACAMPVIATRYSGQTDFLDDDNSYLVDIDGFRKAEKELALVSYFYENAEFPILGDSVVEQFRVKMREAYENKDEADAKANRLYDRVTSEYDWDSCISMMHDKVSETYEALTK